MNSYNYIEKVEDQWLKKLKIDNKCKYELEIRFSEITKEIYELIFYEFYKKYINLKIIETNKLEKVIYEKNVFYIQNEEYYKTKKRLKWLYLKNISANITLSRENNMLNSDKKINYDMKMIKKKRVSFIDIIDNLSYNFTITDNNIYQIEIEILNITSNITNNNINKINNGIHKIIEILPLNIKKILKQPTPLKSKDILKDFALTEKLDGLRSILHITNDGKVILIKNNFRIKIITNLKIKNYKNIIIDGELIKDKIFYAFDVIVFENIPLEENLIKRIEKLKMLKFSSKKGKMDIYYRVKKYYYDNIINNSKLLLKNKNKHNIDGLIFNSISQNYKNSIIYKWKNIITFDFMMKKNNDLWELHCYDRNKFSVNFSEFVKNYYKIKSDKDLDIKYKDGIIIEFKHDENNNTFFPLKIRNDKFQPNYIGVALDNWECHINKIDF